MGWFLDLLLGGSGEGTKTTGIPCPECGKDEGRCTCEVYDEDEEKGSYYNSDSDAWGPGKR